MSGVLPYRQMSSYCPCMSEEWLTYAEAAEHLGIKVESVKKRAQRRLWRRRTGNDGRTRVLLPTDSPAPIPADIPTTLPPDSPPVSVPDDTRERLAAAETEVRLLRERVADLTADRDAMRDALARAASQAQTVGRVGGFWARLFGGT